MVGVNQTSTSGSQIGESSRIFHIAGFLFLRFERLGVLAGCCSVCKPNPLKVRERGRLIALPGERPKKIPEHTGSGQQHP